MPLRTLTPVVAHPPVDFKDLIHVGRFIYRQHIYNKLPIEMNLENTTIYNQINLNCWMVAAQIQLNKKVAIYLKPGVGFPQMSLKQGSLYGI